MRLVALLPLFAACTGTTPSSLVIYLADSGSITNDEFTSTCTDTFINATCAPTTADESDWTYSGAYEASPPSDFLTVHLGHSDRNDTDCVLILASGDTMSCTLTKDRKDRRITASRTAFEDGFDEAVHTTGYRYEAHMREAIEWTINLDIDEDGGVSGRFVAGYEMEERYTESDLYDDDEVFPERGNFCGLVTPTDDDFVGCINTGESSECSGDCEVRYDYEETLTYNLEGILLEDTTTPDHVVGAGFGEGI